MALKGKVFIAGPYDAELVAQITAHFQELLHTEVSLSVKRDDELIGGFLAIVDGKLYDSSLRTRMDILQQHLFSEKA